jgi:hypothetical protein
LKPRTLSLLAVAALALTGCASSTNQASTSESSSSSRIESVDDLIRMYVNHGGECKNREKTLRTDDSEFTMCNDRLRFQVYPHKDVPGSELTANADVGNYILYRDNWAIMSPKKQLVDEAETHVDAIRHPDPEPRKATPPAPTPAQTPDPTPSPSSTRSDGTLPSGSYRVGDQIQPGTYAAEAQGKNPYPFTSCYWETRDNNGNIIDNNFVTSGYRVEAYVPPEATSFFSERCGSWKQQ